MLLNIVSRLEIADYQQTYTIQITHSELYCKISNYEIVEIL